MKPSQERDCPRDPRAGEPLSEGVNRVTQIKNKELEQRITDLELKRSALNHRIVELEAERDRLKAELNRINEIAESMKDGRDKLLPRLATEER